MSVVPFTHRSFVADGDPVGLLTVERINWGACAGVSHDAMSKSSLVPHYF